MLQQQRINLGLYLFSLTLVCPGCLPGNADDDDDGDNDSCPFTCTSESSCTNANGTVLGDLGCSFDRICCNYPSQIATSDSDSDVDVENSTDFYIDHDTDFYTDVASDTAGASAVGTLSAAVISSSVMPVEENRYHINFNAVVFDADGDAVPTLTSNAFTLEDFTLSSGEEFIWDDYLTCATTTFTNAADAVSVVLTMDQSGSITSTDPNDVRISAAKEFLHSLSSSDESYLVSFAQGNSCTDYDITGYGVTTSADFGAFTDDHTAYFSTLDGFIGCESGGTPLYDASLSSIDALQQNAVKASSAVVLFTDGDDTASFASMDDVISRATGNDTRVFTIGLSEAVNYDVLSKIARGTSGAFFYAYDMGHMVSAFRGMNNLLTGTYTVYECADTLHDTSGKQWDWILTAVRVSHDSHVALAYLWLDF